MIRLGGVGNNYDNQMKNQNKSGCCRNINWALNSQLA